MNNETLKVANFFSRSGLVPLNTDVIRYIYALFLILLIKPDSFVRLRKVYKGSKPFICCRSEIALQATSFGAIVQNK
jgi:hypothetical protein